MAIEKKVINTGKKILTGALITGALVFGGCRDNKEEKPPVVPSPPIVNQAPDTVIGEDFGDGLTGMVDYTICGDDSDGYTNYLEVWENGVYSKKINTTQENPFCIYFSTPIIPGTNTLEARASDNEGLDDPTIATSNFYSPTEVEASGTTNLNDGFIDTILNNHGLNLETNYLKNVPANAGVSCGGSINSIDYSINSAYFIEFISHTDNLTEKLSDKEKIDCSGDPNRYFIYLPLSEIETRLNSWISGEFQ